MQEKYLSIFHLFFQDQNKNAKYIWSIDFEMISSEVSCSLCIKNCSFSIYGSSVETVVSRRVHFILISQIEVMSSKVFLKSSVKGSSSITTVFHAISSLRGCIEAIALHIIELEVTSSQVTH